MYSYNKYPFSFAFYSVKEKEIGRLWLKLRFCPVWFYSVHSVLYSPFCPLWSYLIQYSSIRSTLVLFGPLWYYSVYFDSIRSIRSIWSYVAHFYFHSVQCGPFGPILFTSVPFGPILSTSWISLFFPPFSRNTNRTKKYVYGERSCERQGWRYLHNDIYIYIYINSYLILN